MARTPHRRAALLLGLLCLAASGVAPAAAATPGESLYIVVEIAADGQVEPVFLTRVGLRHQRPSMGELEQADALAASGRAHETLGLVVYAEGEVAYRDVVTAVRELRGEFHGDRREAGFAIDAHHVEPARAAAVLRLPAVEGGVLELGGRQTTLFDLDELERGAAELRLGGFAAPSQTAAARRDGDPGNRVDLLIMGDGYTAAQAAAFAADAAALQSSFFSLTPYAEYANFVNVSSLFTASTQPGADHPPYNPSCVGDDPSCCADPSASSDPLAGSYVSTAFDARFCAYNIHRLLVVDTTKVLAAAAAVPDWDQIFVVVNDGTYGGSGGSIAVSSTHPAAPDVIRHEYGHSFTNLADEYESPYPGYPGCSDVSGPTCERNVTDVTTRAAIKWEPWIDPATPVPTPEASGYGDVVGLFEGARYQPSAMYRPRDTQCLMRSLGVPFCEVCAESYVLTLYDGGWGDPWGGIDLVEPGSESPPPGAVQINGSGTFSVELLEPAGGPPLAVEWSVDGVVQGGASGAGFVFTPPASGSYELVLTVGDATSLVHPELAGDSLSSSRAWTVEATVDGLIFADGFESGGTGGWNLAVP